MELLDSTDKPQDDAYTKPLLRGKLILFKKEKPP
jgi:hypothetical protein